MSLRQFCRSLRDGIKSITLFPSLNFDPLPSNEEALRKDWEAVGQNMRRAFEAAKKTLPSSGRGSDKDKI